MCVLSRCDMPVSCSKQKLVWCAVAVDKLWWCDGDSGCVMDVWPCDEYNGSFHSSVVHHAVFDDIDDKL